MRHPQNETMKKDFRYQDYTQWDLPESAKARLGTGYLTGNITYSPDGTLLVIPKSSGIWVYDASTLEVVDLIDQHRLFNSAEIRNSRQWRKPIEAGNAVGFSSDGSLFSIRVEWQAVVDIEALTSNSETYILQIWGRKKEQPKSISIECPEKIDSMVFSPDGTTLAGSKDGTIYLWNVHTGKLQNTLTVKATNINAIVFSPDGSTLASTSCVGTGQFGVSASDGEIYEGIDSYIDV